MGGTSMRDFSQQFAEAKGLLKPAAKKNVRENKFGAKRTRVGMITFHSKTEADFYSRLLLLQKGGAITKLELQPKYLLQEAFEARNGEKHQAIYYLADFEVVFPDGTIKVYDTKGTKTEEYMLKKKLLLFRYPELLFEEVYFPLEHPVNSSELSIETVKSIREKASIRSKDWENRFTKKTLA